MTRSRLTRSVALAAALALAGCSTTPGTERVRPTSATTTLPGLAPAASASAQSGLAIDRWWTLFGDRTLDAVVDEALAHNEDLEAAAARIREAQASLDVARASLFPTLDLDVQSGRAQQATSTKPLPPGVDRRATTHAISLTASYELDLWGKLASSTSAARHELLSREWARASLQWSLTASVAQTYFSLAALDRQIAISEAVRGTRHALVEARQLEYGAGAGNEFDVRRAQSELAATDATLAALRRERVSLDRTMLLLLGRSPMALAAGAPAPLPLDETAVPSAVLPEGALADLLAQRPDLRQIEDDLAAANASIDAARAATLPSVRLIGSIGSDARRLGDLFSASSILWSLAAGVTHALFDGGRAQAQVRVEHARAEQALASYRKAVASAVLDVREAYAALDLANEALRADAARVDSLDRARQLARLGYDNGALSYLEYLDAERNWYQARLDHVTAYRDWMIGQVAAYKAFGGGYTKPDVVAHIHPEGGPR